MRLSTLQRCFNYLCTSGIAEFLAHNGSLINQKISNDLKENTSLKYKYSNTGEEFHHLYVNKQKFKGLNT